MYDVYRTSRKLTHSILTTILPRRHAEIYRLQRGEAHIKAKQYQKYNREQNASRRLPQDTNREETERAAETKKDGS